MRILRIALLGSLALALATPSIASDCWQAPVQLQRIGHPIWKPVDFHVFTAAIGTADDGYAEFGLNQINLLYPLRHQSCTELGIGPGAPHQPPYVQEMEAGLDVMNFADSQFFGVREFSSGKGVWAVWMTVPHPGTTGSSPDFTSGPIIPNALFPIHVYGQTYRNNQLWDPYPADFDVPPLTPELSCPFNVDGHSHFPIFLTDNADFGPGGPIAGQYEYRVKMTDVNGNGWSITVYFSVGK